VPGEPHAIGQAERVDAVLEGLAIDRQADPDERRVRILRDDAPSRVEQHAVTLLRRDAADRSHDRCVRREA
jgi:hypothetical protein